MNTESITARPTLGRTFRAFFAAAALVLALPVAALASDADVAKSQAVKVYTSFKKKDWSGLFDLCAFPPKVKPTAKDRSDFVSAIEKGTAGTPEQKKQFDEFTAGISNIAAGKPTISGSKATVPTSSTITFRGKKMKFAGVIQMVKAGGTWKWDLTSGNAQQVSMATQQLLGRPIGK